MKYTFLYIVLIALVSCKPRQASVLKPEQVSISNSEWKLIKLNQEDVSALNPPITLSLDETQEKITGFAGCNRFFGSYELNQSNVKFTGLGSTKMYCQDKSASEDQYLKALSEVQSYKLNGSKLLLLAGDKVILEFKK